jgi:glycosyltransferase involved in cell wall biosynthesis
VAADLARVALGRRNARTAYAAWQPGGRAPDLVYERYAVFQALGRPFQARGTPWVLETQGLFFHEARHDRKSIALGGLARRLELAAYRDADVVVAVTEVLKGLLIREARVDPAKIVVVPNGVDTQRFVPADEGRVSPRLRPTIGFVGGLLRWQGLDRLLEALAQLRGAGREFDLVIVGDGEERANLTSLATARGLQDRVSFLGRVDGDRVPELIRGFDVGFSGHLPSALGGMYHSPLKIYEYMACGIPVVASDFADARAVVAGKGTGFLFEAGHAEDLVRVLTRVHEQRDQLPAMGRLAREEILARHSWRARVEKMMSEVQVVLASRPTGAQAGLRATLGVGASE